VFDPAKVSNDKRLPFSRQFAIPGRLDFLLAAARGGFWLLSNGRIQKYSATALEKDYGPYPWNKDLIIAAACEDPEGNLLIGTYGDPGDGVPVTIGGAGKGRGPTRRSYQR
jgi:hypothetical protein